MAVVPGPDPGPELGLLGAVVRVAVRVLIECSVDQGGPLRGARARPLPSAGVSWPSERYGVTDDEVEIERVRLSNLAKTLDPGTFRLLDRVGVEPGMHVLEVGAGTGSVSAWLAERVGGDGRVMSTDIDLRFHAEMPPNVIVRQHDAARDRLPPEHFHLIHARAVIQHIPEREAVMARLVDALCPGGAVVIEDGAMAEFASQTLPEPLGSIHRIVATGSGQQWRDHQAGVRILGWMRELGLEDLDARGSVRIMRPHEASGEWWFLALERAVPRLVEAGAVPESDAATALEQMRAPGFAMLGPTSIATIGRKPAFTVSEGQP
ncbi:MAG: methyltransferase domain-containing protein [Acidimicrobiaceae bacterium]|nr:methyltransferase domain-containing protein [Acidimicrobiaceae bacterium]MXZ66261.1 methyltransferase domain-containing protein [Acidimicrobiaceae bacterium]MYF32382.1 methyltransferase domain-containing protein [Acidimicrobiaceae bacterium]MYG77458.1 methyltransferase domain-containing protein [Acidimicrobiaceae bacterium]MYJ30041.1 methyltransferase domain-containing protein [Acidimicrobiaceae bacterium]